MEELNETITADDTTLPVEEPSDLNRLAALLLLAITIVSVGVAGWSWQAALVTFGAVFAVWSWLFFGEVA